MRWIIWTTDDIFRIDDIYNVGYKKSGEIYEACALLKLKSNEDPIDIISQLTNVISVIACVKKRRKWKIPCNRYKFTMPRSMRITPSGFQRIRR